MKKCKFRIEEGTHLT